MARCWYIAPTNHHSSAAQDARLDIYYDVRGASYVSSGKFGLLTFHQVTLAVMYAFHIEPGARLQHTAC